MDFRFTEEEEAFRQEVRAFIAEHLTEEVVGSTRLDTPARREFLSKMAARGWLARGWPSEYGGWGDAMPLAQYILNQELHLAGAPIVGKNLGVVANTLLRHGSEKLKQAFLPRILANEIQWALCYSEPDAGSDLASLKTTAVLDGDEFVVNGQKRFITGAHFADYFWTAVRTDPEAPKHKGISLLIIDAKTPGISYTPMYTVYGERTNDVFFDHVRVPQDYLVGELNRGWYYISEALDYERFAILSFTPVVRRFEHFLDWLRRAEVDGRPLAADPVIRRKVGRLAVMVEAGRMLEMRCIGMAVRPDYVPNTEAAMNKVWSGIMEMELADVIMDLVGAVGYLADGEDGAPMGGELVRAYLEGGHHRVAAAGVDVSKNILAKRLLGLPPA